MTKPFTFDTESAVNILNTISGQLEAWKKHSENLTLPELINRNKGRIEAYEKIHDYLLEIFKINGLEILQLETEDVEEETQTHIDVYGILGRAFSHFSK